MLNFAERRQAEVSPRQLSPGERVSRKYRRAMIRKAEYLKLKSIVPSVAKKKSVSKLTVIEEAIRYIDELHSALAVKMTGIIDHDDIRCDYHADAFIRDLCCNRKWFQFSEKRPEMTSADSQLRHSHSLPPMTVVMRTPLSDRQPPMMPMMMIYPPADSEEDNEEDEEDEEEGLLQQLSS